MINKSKIRDMITIARSATEDVGTNKIETKNILDMVTDKSKAYVSLCNHKDLLLSEHIPLVMLISKEGECEEVTEENMSTVFENNNDSLVAVVTKGIYRNPEIAREFYKYMKNTEERESGFLSDPYMHWCVMVNITLNEAFDDFVEFRTYWSESFWNLCRMRDLSVSETLDCYRDHITG